MSIIDTKGDLMNKGSYILINDLFADPLTGFVSRILHGLKQNLPSANTCFKLSCIKGVTILKETVVLCQFESITG